LRQRLVGGLARRAHLDLVAALLEEARHREGEGGLVFRHQHAIALAHQASPPVLSTTRNPPPRRRGRQSRSPPRARTRLRAMARPSPVPRPGSVVKYGLKIWARKAAGTPGPVSSTSSCTSRPLVP